MTHVNTKHPLRQAKRVGLLAGLGLLTQLLIACTSTNSINFPSFASNSTAASTEGADAQPQSKQVAIAQVIGAPPTVAQKLSSSLAKAAGERKLTVADNAKDGADYSVRGYLVAAADKKGTKLSYIWDVSDTTGKRAHRIKGEELISGKQLKKGTDPWSLVNDKAIDSIATKTAARIAAWLPNKQPAPVNPEALIAKKSTPAPKQTQVAKAAPPAPVMKKKPLPRAPTTASIKKKPAPAPAPVKVAKVTPPATPKQVVALVPTVQGAPGDGEKSLTTAIKKQLFSHGVKLASATAGTGGAAYTVQGAVKLTPASQSNKQDIAIEWRVIDPSGRKLGTVSQRNSIPKGSLNGPWGKTADAAAAAAAEGILKLLPKPKK